MFDQLEKYARDDTLVKLIFDHLRNIGIAGLMLGAAEWKRKQIEPTFGDLCDIVAGVVLFCIGFGLIWLNHENLFSKIRENSTPRWLKFFFVILYGIMFGEFLKYMRVR